MFRGAVFSGHGVVCYNTCLSVGLKSDSMDQIMIRFKTLISPL